MTIEKAPTMSSSPALSPPAASDSLVPTGSWRVSEESRIGFAVKGLSDDRAAID
jgi:hypothetical protein